MKLDPKVVSLAEQCRADVVAAGFFPDTLECACLVASAHLAMTLRKRGIWARFAVGIFTGDGICRPKNSRDWNHCWVTVGNRVVDVTATQFGPYPEVFVPVRPEQRRLYKAGRLGLRRFEEGHSWHVSRMEHEFLRGHHGRSPFVRPDD